MSAPTLPNPETNAMGKDAANDSTAGRDGDPSVAPDAAAVAPATLPGLLLGGYQLCEVIGSGGMGVVYRAIDARLDRSVAIKVMKAEAATSEDARRRFLREARMQSRVESDHVVPVFAADEIDGVPFLVMPLLRGQSLAQRLREGRVPLPEALLIARDVALGIAAAHRLELIHRDVKPSNIWLEESGRAKLMDFGLVRRVADDGEHTLSGNIIGTPHYMAPEQAKGEVVDKKADLFGLGCVLFELCTGVRPFAAAQIADILDNVRSADPPEIQSLNPAVPPPLAELIRRLLAKSPADRPSDAESVADHLAAMATSVAPTQPDAAPAARSLRWPIAAALAATLAMGALWIWLTNSRGSITTWRAIDRDENQDSAPGKPEPLSADWVASMQRMSRVVQQRELQVELQRRNPRFHGELQFDTWENDRCAKVKVDSHGLVDLTPFAAIPGLLVLECMGEHRNPGDIVSIEAIRGLPLVQAGFSNNPIRDLSPLAGMPIHSLWITGVEANDFSPIYDMPLEVLHATSLSPNARIDASRLVGKPLVDLWLEPEQTLNFERLREIATLKLIRNQPADEFWKTYDAKK